MNVLPTPPGAVAKAHYHEGIETIAYCSKVNAPCITAAIFRSKCWCASSVSLSPTCARAAQRIEKPCTWIVVHSSGSDQDGIVLLPELDARLGAKDKRNSIAEVLCFCCWARIEDIVLV